MTNLFLDLPPRDLLRVIHNHLNQRFFADSKAASKRLFKSLAHGTEAPFIAISTEESGDIRSVLRLDMTAVSGKFNFRLFREALAAHLYRIDQALADQNDATADSANVYVDQDDSSRLVFNLPGVTDSNGHINALVSGVEVTEPGSFVVKLVFLPVEQDAPRSD
ncbi:MAG: hypothetical protein AAF465_00290 [Pseudomonadota bacterium]